MNEEHISAPAVAAIVAAAGRSTRMGEPKQLLPWKEGTVIETVVRHLHAGGADPIFCVVGHRSDQVQDALRNVPNAAAPAHIVPNPHYRSAEMLSSYQVGIEALQAYETEAARSGSGRAQCIGALFALGDQPHIPPAVIRQVCEQAIRTPDAPVIPSHAMRRGHPFYLPRAVFPEITALQPEDTLRTVVNRHARQIVYVDVASDAILRDMDTPADYAELRSTKGE